MTAYWAHYHTQFKKPDGTRGNGWTDTFPVVGYTDVALIIDAGGNVRTVQSLLEDFAEGGDTPNEDGETYAVYLEVNTNPEG